MIATYVARIPELVINPESGWLVSAGQVKALAEYRGWDREKLSATGRRGRARGRARNDVNGSARQLEALFARASVQD